MATIFCICKAENIKEPQGGGALLFRSIKEIL